jgi:hypothetical protein
MLLASFLWYFNCAALPPTDPYEPWGIHLAYSAPDPTTAMQVMWSTRQMVEGPLVFLTTGPQGLQGAQGLPAYPHDAPLFASSAAVSNYTAQSRVFSDSNNTQVIHWTNMTGLQPNQLYYYQLADVTLQHMSAVFAFRTPPTAYSASAPPTIAIFADIGTTPNGYSTMARVADEVGRGTIQFIAVPGDHGYDMEDNDAQTGDEYMMMIQNASAYVPYHVGPGNHENANDFAQYRGRFNFMPNTPAFADSMFHSVNVGQVHLIFLSSETYFYLTAHGVFMVKQQYDWLKQDLDAVNRLETPWIVLMAHRPLYCSPNDDGDDCHNLYSIMRDGYLGALAVEPLLIEYGVDIFIGAHEHSYERNYPVYSCSWDATRTGPDAFVDFELPIHILSGAAGNRENQDPWQPVGNGFSAARVNAYGYGKMTVYNATHIFWQFIDDSTGEAVDSVWIIQHSHGPFNPGAIPHLTHGACNATVPYIAAAESALDADESALPEWVFQAFGPQREAPTARRLGATVQWPAEGEEEDRLPSIRGGNRGSKGMRRGKGGHRGKGKGRNRAGVAEALDVPAEALMHLSAEEIRTLRDRLAQRLAKHQQAAENGVDAAAEGGVAMAKADVPHFDSIRLPGEEAEEAAPVRSQSQFETKHKNRLVPGQKQQRPRGGGGGAGKRGPQSRGRNEPVDPHAAEVGSLVSVREVARLVELQMAAQDQKA